MPGKGHRKIPSPRTDAEMENHVRVMVHEITAAVNPKSFRQKIKNQAQYLDGDYLEAAGLVVDSIKERITTAYTRGGKLYSNVFHLKRFLKIAGPVLERVLMAFRFQIQEIYNEIMEEKMLSLAQETSSKDIPEITPVKYHHPIVYEFVNHESESENKSVNHNSDLVLINSSDDILVSEMIEGGLITKSCKTMNRLN